MSEFAKASPPSTNFIAGGTFEGSATPSTVVRVLFTFGSLGSLEPSWNASGFLSSMRCFMPRAASPASYMPGLSFARGSLTSEPVMPAGIGGAGCGANGSTGCGAAGVADGAGDGEDVCANVFAAKPEHKTTKATNNWKVVVCTRFIFPPKIFVIEVRTACGSGRLIVRSVYVRRQPPATAGGSDLRFFPQWLCPNNLRLCRLMCGRPLTFRSLAYLDFALCPVVGAQPQIYYETGRNRRALSHIRRRSRIARITFSAS